MNPLSSKEIANKTLILLKDSKKAEEFGQAGYERIKNNFNLENMVREYIAAYETLLKKKE
ncbi:hypothetical protein HOE22_02440 [Candidatus Woesearchaeota archaeon]|nr:hypothetical protein [Candidatus Woesearchaeota archaeon]